MILHFSVSHFVIETFIHSPCGLSVCFQILLHLPCMLHPQFVLLCGHLTLYHSPTHLFLLSSPCTYTPLLPSFIAGMSSLLHAFLPCFAGMLGEMFVLSCASALRNWWLCCLCFYLCLVCSDSPLFKDCSWNLWRFIIVPVKDKEQERLFVAFTFLFIYVILLFTRSTFWFIVPFYLLVLCVWE